MAQVNVRRLAAIDLHGAQGTARRRRIVLGEFIAGAVAAVAFGGWLAVIAPSPAGRLFGLWIIGTGLNYVPLSAYAIALRRPGALSAELEGIDIAREGRRYSMLQLWIFVPLALVVQAALSRRAGERDSA